LNKHINCHVFTANGTGPSPVYSNFLTRPLKRSISQMSQTSSRTHLSTVSSPPNIPPLDLRPAFSGQTVDTPPLRTPTRLSATQVLPSIAGALQELPSGCDDASSLHADSFISAQSAGQPDRNPYSQAEQGSVQSHATRSIPDSHSASSSFVGRRWTASLSFGSDLLLLSKSRESHQRLGTTPARMLFWLGFIAPWCWLIGGWVLTRGGKTKGEGNSSSIRLMLLPLWKKGPDKDVKSGKRKEEAPAVQGKQGYGFGHGYPFVVPSVESLTPSVKMLRMNTEKGTKSLDPWVKRCRIAAVISGILILIALVVAIIATRGYHRQESAGAE
jgi:hypothetical protein